MTAPAQNPTRVLMITDASGSMQKLRDDVIGGQHAYLTKLVEDSGTQYKVSQILFNTQVTWVDKDVPANLATRFDRAVYHPNGFTALFDAIGQALAWLEAQPVFVGETDVPWRVLVLIQTDGLENSSVEYQEADVKRRLEEIQKAGVAVIFSGTGPDGWANRGGLGMTANSTRSAASSVGTQSTYGSLAAATVEYANAPTVLRSANLSGLVQKGIDEAGGTDPTA